MNQELEKIDEKRVEINSNLENKHQYSQFLTPLEVARYMVSLFEIKDLKEPKILDAGAGLGILTAALLERIDSMDLNNASYDCTAIEIDPFLIKHIEETFSLFENKLVINKEIINADFVTWATELLNEQMSLFQQDKHNYNLAILNPPYQKIRSNSKHKKMLRKVGIETVNLYSAFVALAIKLLAPKGQVVAIIPRSFCNGLYYKPFRKLLLSDTAIKHIHLYKARNQAFKEDDVLQENIIILLEKGAVQKDVKISTSTDITLHDYDEYDMEFEQVVYPEDKEQFIRIPSNTVEVNLNIPRSIVYSLADLGIEISTGPVVSFRNQEYLKVLMEEQTVPLLYPTHIRKNKVIWANLEGSKPNAIIDNKNTEKLLYSMGYYTIMRRRSSKEDAKRIISAVINPNDFINSLKIGFDNGINVLHKNKKGLSPQVAFGLHVYLSSTFVDHYFRTFNGSTQVNATDLRTMKFPSLRVIESFGEWYMKMKDVTQEDIDKKIEEFVI